VGVERRGGTTAPRQSFKIDEWALMQNYSGGHSLYIYDIYHVTKLLNPVWILQTFMLFIAAGTASIFHPEPEPHQDDAAPQHCTTHSSNKFEAENIRSKLQFDSHVSNLTHNFMNSLNEQRKNTFL
jgi:hypothetical protein